MLTDVTKWPTLQIAVTRHISNQNAFLNLSHRVLILMMSSFGLFIVRNGRNRPNRQTGTHTNRNPPAHAPRVNYIDVFYFEFHTAKTFICIYKVNPLIQETNSVVQLYWLIEGVPSRRLGGVRGGSLCWESTDSIRLTVDNE